MNGFEMSGLELSRAFYEEYGRPMLERDFPELLPLLAVGLVGSGSERYGFDDAVSRDHDFEPGFCIFLPGEDILDRRSEFRLERAYAKLPKEYAGVKRLPISPVGGNRSGVMRTADFYTNAVGAPDGCLSMEAWLHIPDYALAEATNGAVYYDGFGEFSRIREALRHMPEDARCKRLAGNLLLMAQSGQYNYVRCLQHGEPAAARLAVASFVNAAMKAAFLLRGRYLPYYKWGFRALRELENGALLVERLEQLLCSLQDEAQTYDAIEAIASMFVTELQERGLTKATCGDLEKHAYSVNDRIADSNIRNMHILTAI